MSRIPGLTGNMWPDPGDVRLLRFLLHSDPAEAMAAWSVWRPGWDPDTPTTEQYRLYPLMAERVAALVPDEPKLGMLQGVRLQCTIQNLLLLDRLEDVLATLDRAGIQGVVLKGAALALSAYEHVGQRPFHDLDVLVDPRRHADAFAAFIERGWLLEYGDFTGNQAVTLGRAGTSLDLHRKHSAELVVTGQPTSSWDSIETVKARRPLAGGRIIDILAPADSLLHVVAHGTQADESVLLRWAADAHRLITRGDMDWERVLWLAGLFQVRLPVHDALVFLRSTTGVSVPSEVLGRLKAARVPGISRRRLAAFHQMPNIEGRLGGLALHLRREFQYTLDQPWLTAVTATPLYFSTVLGLQSPRQLPVHIARVAWRRRHGRIRPGGRQTTPQSVQET